jgi:glucose-6-phosphate dehydrogenase assembly protein OpcA
VSLDVHPIADQLTQARHSAGAMSAATMTFVLYFDRSDIADWVTGRTRKVADKHPCRVIIFDGTKPRGEQHADPSSTRGEWIEIGVQDATPAEVAAALTMLALPEAPVVLVWVAGHIASDEHFTALAKLASTVVCNTALSGEDTTDALKELIAYVEAHPEIWVQDLAYIRLAAWQEIIAEFFDGEDHRGELHVLTEVEVAAGSESEMYYLLGWLASRLGWRLRGPGEFTSGTGMTIRYTMKHEGPPRRVAHVTLRSAQATYTASVHPDDPGAVVLSVANGAVEGDRCAPLHTMDIASMIERAILINRRDDVFIQSLAVAKAMLEKQ